MKSNLELLEGWISKNSGVSYNPVEEIWNLGHVLGQIMKEVNQASEIFKTVSKSPSRSTASAARTILTDISNYQRIKTALQALKGIVNNESFSKVSNSKSILRMIHYLERAEFGPEQVARLKQIAEMDSEQSGTDFPEEVNQAGLEKLLRNSIYNSHDGSSKTLKVVREVLQNAVDATDPKQHPELESRPGFKPEIHIETHTFHPKDAPAFIDISVEDKGIGMDWDTLSRKFFVTFESGKGQDTGAAGGYGIAKALIQDAPEHGWSMDTNSIHSGRFHKNVYFGTRRDSKYVHPTSEIKKHGDGATLSMHGLPWAQPDSIKEICDVYAINGRVKIFLNGEEQAPRFTLDSQDVKNLDSNISALPGIMSEDEAEKQIAETNFPEYNKKLADGLGKIGSLSSGKTKYKFYLRKTIRSGKLYVMVNGHYQFDREKYISKLDVICSIETTARPGDDEYPLDPGRENIRNQEINSEIEKLVNTIKGFSEKVSQDDLFKEGIESIMVNPDADPMTVRDSESTTSKKESMLHALSHIAGEKAFSDESPKDADETPEESPKETGRPDDDSAPVEDSPSDEEPAGKVPETTDEVAEELSKLAGPNSPIGKSTIKKMVEDAMEVKDPVEQNRRLDSLIEGLTTPGTILIQKNFMARSVISENSQVTGNMLILWQKTLRLILQKLSATVYAHRTRPLVPGLIYSNKCLGLYVPEKEASGRKHASISVNPVTLAAYVLPKLFREKLEGKREKEAFEMLEESEEKDDTPVSRTSKFLFHLAIHEICHFLHPDGYGSENFHRNITKLELICHDEYEQVKKLVKMHMKDLRRDARSLIGLVAKSTKKTGEMDESFVVSRFEEWCDRKNQSPTISRRSFAPEVVLSPLKAGGFKDFVRKHENGALRRRGEGYNR